MWLFIIVLAYIKLYHFINKEVVVQILSSTLLLSSTYINVTIILTPCSMCIQKAFSFPSLPFLPFSPLSLPPSLSSPLSIHSQLFKYYTLFHTNISLQPEIFKGRNHVLSITVVLHLAHVLYIAQPVCGLKYTNCNIYVFMGFVSIKLKVYFF